MCVAQRQKDKKTQSLFDEFPFSFILLTLKGTLKANLKICQNLRLHMYLWK